MDTEAEFENLTHAIKAGNTEAIQAAIAARFNVTAKDHVGRTLLMFAAEAGQTDIVNILIAAGAKLDTRDQLSIASSIGGGETALHRAAANHHTEIVKALLAAGAKIDVVDKSKRTPLADAVEGEDATIAEILLNAGANPNGSERGPTPLSSATCLGDLRSVKLLLQYGANPNHPADARSPALNGVLPWGYVEICRELIKAGADVNARDTEDGKTALDIITFAIENNLWTGSQMEKGVDKVEVTKNRKAVRAMLIEAGAKLAQSSRGS
jgi:ankyrin repeat protein